MLNVVEFGEHIRVVQLVQLRADKLLLVLGLGHKGRQSVLIRIVHDLGRNLHGTIGDRVQGRIYFSNRIVLFRHHLGQALGRDQEDLFGDSQAARANHTQRDPGEDIRVVALACMIDPPVVLHRWAKGEPEAKITRPSVCL